MNEFYPSLVVKISKKDTEEKRKKLTKKDTFFLFDADY